MPQPNFPLSILAYIISVICTRANTVELYNNSYLAIAENTPIDVIELGSTFINKCCSDL